MTDRESDSSPKSSLIARRGCIIFILAALLVAVQRYIVFCLLVRWAVQGSAPADQIATFLFGEPPVDLFDLLLGLDLAPESLILMLQPRSLAVIAIQGSHMLLNVGLVCVPFWLFEVAQRSSRARRWLAYAAGFLVGLLIVGSMVLALWWVYAPPGHQSAAADLASVQVLSTPSPPTAQPVATTKHYSDTETGVSFDYPEYLTLEAQTQKRREATGQVVTFTLISAQSSDPFMAIIVRLIEDPLREELYPNLYPPTESSLRMLLRSEIVDLELSTSTDKIDAVLEASNKAQLTAVGGYPAALYTLVLTTTDYGDLYLRGAMIVTDRRDISVHIIGSTEPDIPGSVQPGVIDQVWSQVIKSFSADY